MSEKIYVPSLSRKTVKALTEQIRPVVFVRSIGHCYVDINPNDSDLIFNQCYLKGFNSKYLRDIVVAKDLTPFGKIKTYHLFGIEEFFVPSYAEVVSQIPESIRHLVTEFETVQELVNPDREALHDGYHTAVTTIYIKKK